MESVKSKDVEITFISWLQELYGVFLVRELACTVCGCVRQRVKRHSQSK